jgi:hypothetical protein
MNEHLDVIGPVDGMPIRRLGRLPARASRKALQFSDFLKFLEPPKKTAFWKNRSPFPQRHFGNLEWGDCTIAKQAIAAMRMERIEQRRNISITDEEVINVYRAMVRRVYNTDADEGAYETDALDNWRRPEFTFKDESGHPFTIDAYLRINPFNHVELKAGIALSGAHGVAICLNLPAAFATIDPPSDWHIPEGQQPIGDWMPGTWGGHSMWTRDYDEVGIWLVHTWDLPDQRITWEAAAIYLDEAHLVIDSVDVWRKKLAKAQIVGDRKVMNKIVEAVNDVSSHKLEV